jgi:autotransporter-associated beta strand protein
MASRRRMCRRRFSSAAVATAVMGITTPVVLAAAVSLTKTSNTSWTLSNGNITAIFNPSSEEITSVQLGSGSGASANLLSQLDEEFAGTPFGAGTQTFNSQVGANNSYVDVWTTVASAGSAQNSNGTYVNPIGYAFHYLIFANDPTIYCYETLNHSATDPVTSVGQGQFLFRSNPTLFPNLYQINTGPNQLGTANAVTTLNVPSTNANWATVSAQAGRSVQNATTDLTGSGIAGDNGTNFFTKYDYSTYTQFFQAETMYGSSYAVTEVDPSTDTLTGGPTKQELAYTDPGILNMEFLSDHYGIDGNGAGAFPGYAYYPTQGVATSKLYGPYGFTISSTTGSTAASINQSVINSIPTEQAEFNTDSELASSGYINTTARAVVQINNVGNSAGWSSNTSNNTVVLSQPGVNFQESTQGYEYTGQLSQSGNVTISNVVPGTYRLSLYELGQWGETRVDGVQVNGNKISIPQNLKFTPENFGTAAPIWTIGTPNRSSNEFLNGQNATGADQRQYYGAYNYWAEEAALGHNGYISYNATATVINGVAQPATNNTQAWIANQWGTFDPGLYDVSNGTSDNYNNSAPAYVQAAGGPATYSGAPWQIHFSTTAAQEAQGQYVVLSVGLAAAEGSLTVALNGNSETWHVVNQSDPMIRSGDAGYYQFLAYQFPTSDLNAAGTDNVFTLSTSQPDGDMYDALRMEITNTSAAPTTTGWYDYEYITGANSQSDAVDSTALTAVNSFSGSSQWNLSTGGSWSAGTGWGNYIIPGSANDVATFGNTITAASTITLDGNHTVGSVVFNSSSQSYTIAAGTGGTLTLNQSGGTASISDLGGSHTISAPVNLATNTQVSVANASNSLTISGPISGTGNLIISGAGTVVLTGGNTYTGTTSIVAGRLTLDFSQTGAPANNIISVSSPLSMAGGNLYVDGLSNNSSQSFVSTTIASSSSGSITAADNAKISLGAISAQSGGSIVLNGPATVSGTATGTITTTTAGGTGGLLNTGGNNNAYATVGLYDWASTDAAAGTIGTSPYTIIGGSQVSGFYTAVANNTNPGAVNWDVSVQQTPTGPGGTGEGRISSGTQYPASIRFNSPNAPEITIASGDFLETGGVLVTPNTGKINTAVDGLRLAASGVQIVQNNTSAVFIIGSGNGSGCFFSNSNSTTESVVKSGAGTLFLAPTTNNLELNYQNSSGTVTNVNNTSYNYTNAQGSSQYALFLNGGVTVINNTNVLGNPASQASTYAAGGSVNLNGGTLLSDINNVSLTNPAASNASRPVWIGPDGGGLAAATGTIMTVSGYIETSSGGGNPLVIGIPASAANGNVAGLVPGTGGTSANPALNANGIVTLTAANGFFGGTVLDSGTLNINGQYTLGGANYGGLTLNGGTLQYATGITSANGGGDLSAGSGITVASGGGTIDLNGNAITYANNIGNGGSGNLVIASNDAAHAGVLTLAGTSTLTGGINLSSGTLSVAGILSATTPVTVNSGTVLLGNGSAGSVIVAGGTVTPGVGAPYSGSLSMSGLTYNSGILQFGIGANSAGNLSTGSATFNAKPTISFVFSGSPVSGSTYTLVSSATPIAGGSYLTNLTPTTVGRFTFTPSESGNEQIIVTVNGSAGSLYWNNGASTGLWNIQTDSNWLNTNKNAEDVFYQGDNVTFNDNNGGAVNYVVGLSGTVDPLSINVNNIAGSYVFNGPGSIAGATSLVKAGSRTLTLNNTNNYTGGTFVDAGTLQIGVANALPTAGIVTIQGSGVWDLNGNSQTIAGLSDGGVSTGVITSSSGSGLLTIANTAACSFGGTISGSTGIIVPGPATLSLSGQNSYTGYTNVSTGSLIAASNSALGSSNAGTGGLVISPTGTVTFTSAAPSIASLSGSGSVVLANSSGTTLTIGGGNQTSTFSGIISDQSATTSTAVGNLTLTGSGTLTLTGTNTFTGNTTVGGTGKLFLGSSLALQYSTLNLNSTGNFSFGSLTTATLGGLSGSNNLALTNSALASVILNVGNNGTNTTYSGTLTGGGSLVKVGTGTLTLNKTNSYTGYSTINAGNLTIATAGTIGSGGSQSSVTVGDNGNVTVSGGAIFATTMTTNSNGNSSVLLSGGSINLSGTLAVDNDNDDDQGVVTITGGILNAASATVGRTGQNNGQTIQTAGSTSQGIYVDGGTLNLTGALSIGTGNVESSPNVRLDAGGINVGGITTVTVDNNRFSVLDISGGTFNGSGGMLVGGNFDSSSPDAELLIRGGMVNLPDITFGNSTQTGGSNVLELLGGTTYVGAGGMLNNSSSGSVVPTINFGGTTYTGAPILAASAAWSSSLKMILTDTTAGLAPVIQTANISGVAKNITLSGSLTGTGGLIKTGSGILTLSNSGNNFSGPTNVSAGTLVILNGSLPAGDSMTVSLGATLVSDSQSTISNLTSLNLNGNMIVHGGSLTTLNSEVKEGFNNGAWNGTSIASGIPITSTAAASDTTRLHALALIQNDNGLKTSTPLYMTFEGQSVSDSDILLKYTYYGDANLDGKVDGSDYSLIDNGYLKNLTGWFNGDFNYDGVVNGSDYTLIDNAFNCQGAQLTTEVTDPTASIAAQLVGTAAVPEPAGVAMISIIASTLLGRRRGRLICTNLH